jgi:hypothetical protein
MIAPVIVGAVLGLMVIWILVVEHYLSQRQVRVLRQQKADLEGQIALVNASNDVLRDILGEELEDWL